MTTHTTKSLKAATTFSVIGRIKHCCAGLLVMTALLIGVNTISVAQVLAPKSETIVWGSGKHPSQEKEQLWQQSDSVWSVAFSPDGTQVLTGKFDGTAVLRDIKTRQTLQKWRHNGTVFSAAFSPDGKKVLTGSLDSSAVLYDIKSGDKLHIWQHSDSVISVAFSPDGTQVLTGSGNGTVFLYDTRTKKTLQTWRHKERVMSVTFSPDGTQVFTGSWDRSAVLYDIKSGDKLHIWQHSDSVISVAFSPDGTQVLTGSKNGTAVLRDIKTRKTLETWRHKGTVLSVAFSPDGKKVLTGSGDNFVVLRDKRTGRTLQTWMHESAIRSVAFSPDGTRFLIGGLNGTALLSQSASSLPDALKASLKISKSSYRALPNKLAERQIQVESTKPVKDEFESMAQFNARVANWNKAVEALNADIQAHYDKLGPLPLSLRAKAFEQAISAAYGNPGLKDIRYDPESARFFAVLTSSFDPEFERTISIPVPNEQARAARDILMSDNNGLEIELQVTDSNELIWGEPRVNLNGRVIVAQYTDQNFIPPATNQVAASPSLTTIAPAPIATLSPGPAPQISTDPRLAKLQMEVLRREREQAEAAARQAEEKRLRDRLAELNRLTQADFEDDLPSFLSQIPAAKPNPRIHVLAIGIDGYADVPDVPFADRSAQQFAQIAERIWGAQKQNVIVLTNIEATSGRLRGRLRTMLNRLGPQDQLLFYYAGHGVPGKDGSAYLLAQDGGPGSYEEPDLQLEQLYLDVAKSRVGQAKLFIDACFSGRSAKDTLVFEGIAPITVTPTQSFPDDKRLAVLTAGRGDQFSNWYKARGHRLFSYHLMRVLLEDGSNLEVGQLHDRLRERVLDDSRRLGPEFEQEPELQGNQRLAITR